ncbi:hypothetical protein [Aliiruegeria haliotis]|uniref:hypothetical protein n=1 Tax=Aliiruegeria haliotis TaxID=1280846 RepID=UPI001304D74E|nr:hypothetical protein [Aliiruegeria haliotis]
MIDGICHVTKAFGGVRLRDMFAQCASTPEISKLFAGSLAAAPLAVHAEAA